MHNTTADSRRHHIPLLFNLVQKARAMSAKKQGYRIHQNLRYDTCTTHFRDPTAGSRPCMLCVCVCRHPFCSRRQPTASGVCRRISWGWSHTRVFSFHLRSAALVSTAVTYMYRQKGSTVPFPLPHRRLSRMSYSIQHTAVQYSRNRPPLLRAALCVYHFKLNCQRIHI